VFTEYLFFALLSCLKLKCNLQNTIDIALTDSYLLQPNRYTTCPTCFNCI